MKILIATLLSVISLGVFYSHRGDNLNDNRPGWVETSQPQLVVASTYDVSNFLVTTSTIVTTTTTTTTTTTSTTTSTTTTTLPEGSCSEWYSIALEAGWESDQLPKLGRIMWKESRCLNDVANKTYSYGLTQIEWSAHKSWLKSEFGVTEREQLYDPYTNLLVAKWLFDYADRNYGCGWQPWYMSGDWC